MKISFDAIGEKYVTFLAGSGVVKGQVCKVSANDTVSGCAAGNAFCGVVADVRDGCAAVVMGGYVEVPFSDETAPSAGYATLGADGSGGVKSVTSGGRSCLIVHVDETAKTLGLFL